MSNRHIKNVGFVGLGTQGKHLALNMIDAGFALTVFDLKPEPIRELVQAGAQAGSSARTTAAGQDIVVVCVLDDAQLRSVVLGPEGVLFELVRGSILLVHSTVSPSLIEELSVAGEERGVEVVDAPVSGGEQGAKDRTMSFMVGGDPAVVQKCRPLLAASGTAITHTGSVGTAMRAKIVHQLIICVNLLSAYEGMTLGIRAGLSPETLTTVIGEGGAQSRMADNWFKMKLGPHAAKVFYKDLGLCVKLARECELSIPGAALAQQLIEGITP